MSFDPKTPRIGGQRKEAAKRTNVSNVTTACQVITQPCRLRIPADNSKLFPQERIQSIVRKVCGIGLCNQWTPPSMFTACMAIAACQY